MFKFQSEPKTILKTNNKNIEFNKSELKNKYPIYISIGGDKLDNILKNSLDQNLEFYYDKPKIGLYVPLPSKIDKSTQIYYKDWYLFNFEQEILPVLQIMVAKIINISVIEIKKEIELKKYIGNKKEINIIRNAEILKTIRIQNKNERYSNEIKYRSREEYFREVKKQYSFLKDAATKTSKLLLNNVFQNYIKNNMLCNYEKKYLNTINIFSNKYQKQLRENIKLTENLNINIEKIYNRLNNQISKKFNLNIQNINEYQKQNIIKNKASDEIIKNNINKNHQFYKKFYKSIKLKKIKYLLKKHLINSEMISSSSRFQDLNYFSLTEFSNDYIPIKSYFGLIYPLWQYIFYFFYYNNEKNFISKFEELLNINDFTISISVPEEFIHTFNNIELEITNSRLINENDVDSLSSILINFYFKKENTNLVNMEFSRLIFNNIIKKKLYLLIKPLENSKIDIEIQNIDIIDKNIEQNITGQLNNNKFDDISNEILLKNQEIIKNYLKINFINNSKLCYKDNNKYLINLYSKFNNNLINNNCKIYSKILNDLQTFDFKSSFNEIKNKIYFEKNDSDFLEYKMYHIKKYNNFILNSKDNKNLFKKFFDYLNSSLKLVSDDDCNLLIIKISDLENKFKLNFINENIQNELYIYDYEL